MQSIPFRREGVGTAANDKIENVFPCPPIFNSYPDLLPLVVEYATTVEGAVRVPGPYPVLPGTAMSAVISEAGGLALEVDLQRVEVTHYDSAAGGKLANRELVQ